MDKMNKGKIFFSITLILIFFSSSLFIGTSACICERDPRQKIFSLDLMSIFEKNDINNEISILIQKKLPSIGIGVGIHEVTHWGNVFPRTSQYPLIDFDYIPTYAEGGFDLFAYEHLFELDYFTPGMGFYYPKFEKYDSIFFSQYINPSYDTKAWYYYSTFDQNERTSFSYELQEILYEDLPSIPIYYPRELVFLSFDVAGFDENLFYSSEIRADKWYGSSDGWFNYSLPVSFKEYSYFTKNNGKDRLWLNNVYGSLFRRAQETKYWESFLASNYSYTEIVDWKFNVTVEINPEAKFSDGSSVLAEDVKYTYELLLSPEVGATDYNLLTTVFASNASIIVEDSTTVKFCFEDISNYPLSYLSHGIIDKSYLEPFISSYGYSIFDEQPFTGNVSDALVRSCGPFKLDYINKNNNETLLIPNPYWLEGELSSNLTFIKMEDPEEAFIDFLDGKIDIMDNLYTEYLLVQIPDNNSMYQIRFVDVPITYELAVNMKHPVIGTGELTPVGTPGGAKEMRKAISHIIPREYIVSEFLKGLGVPASTYIPKACVGYNSDLLPYAYDFDLAVDYTEYGGYVCMCTPTQTTPSGDRTVFLITLFSLISVSILCQTKLKNKK
ncbi:MAG: hypothetical protein GPJ51_08170 [Candidatus Heimdallarchaeota archaeon]|nr:hypothetical protein [Candidatus Heimdallarchaeota archaeon]